MEEGSGTDAAILLPLRAGGGGGGETLRIVKRYMHLGTQAVPTASPVPEWHARAQSSLLGAEALRKMLRSSTYLTPPTLTLASVPCHSR